jgi:hypothetical protein
MNECIILKPLVAKRPIIWNEALIAKEHVSSVCLVHCESRGLAVTRLSLYENKTAVQGIDGRIESLEETWGSDPNFSLNREVMAEPIHKAVEESKSAQYVIRTNGPTFDGPLNYMVEKIGILSLLDTKLREPRSEAFGHSVAVWFVQSEAKAF